MIATDVTDTPELIRRKRIYDLGEQIQQFLFPFANIIKISLMFVKEF